MNQDELIALWLREEQRPFIGWDFSYLAGRMVQGQEPWSYLQCAAELMQRSSSVLDLGTGGGEVFLQLQTHWHEKVVVTEDYPPNVELATERLSPFGVKVINVPVSGVRPMPFGDGEFDLVLNRHTAFNSTEIARTLGHGARS
jgi:ubiquinone/menaquinone biosynthesis C-methylase UbiE